jgi:hypothetical protein
MNPITIIKSLINENNNWSREHFFHSYIRYEGKTIEEIFLDDKNFIEASDLFLQEIELMVNENMDLNKDIDKIKKLLEKFEHFESNLDRRSYFIEFTISFNKDVLNGSDWDRKNENNQRLLFKKSQNTEAREILRLIAELKERKIKVYKRLEELGMKFYFNFFF